MTILGLENAWLICHQLKTTVVVEAVKPVTDSGNGNGKFGISTLPSVPKSFKLIFNMIESMDHEHLD